MAVVFDSGDFDDADPESEARLQQTLRAARWPDSGRPVFTLATALGLMVFYSLCAQCAATLAVIRRETGSGRWALFTFAYMTGLAYVAALITYQATTFFLGDVA
jgi:ferrous iron transport protein B